MAIEFPHPSNDDAEALRQETRARWAEVEAGRTLDNARVVGWLASWGSTPSRPRPRLDARQANGRESG